MAFAEPSDVATRLGRALTAAEAAMAEQVIEETSGLIIAACGKDNEWADALVDDDEVPPYLRGLCVAKVIAIGSNPEGLAAESEALGAWSESKTYRRDGEGGGVVLTDLEERNCRSAINGTLSASVEVHNPLIDDLADPGLYEPVLPLGERWGN